MVYLRRLIFAAIIFLTPNLNAQNNQITLNVLEWEGYISPFAEEFSKYAKQKGVDAKLNILKPYITNIEHIFEAVRFTEADIVTPTHNYYKMGNGRLMRALVPIDTSRLSNYQSITNSLKKASYDKSDGKTYSVPLLGGSYGLGYNSEKVKEPTSWDVLWSSLNKGKISITNDQFEANLYLAMLMSGYPAEGFYDIDSVKFDEVKVQKRLDALVANCGSFWGGVPDKNEMKSLNYVTDYWFGIAFANQDGQKWKLASPKEGQTVWLDTMALSWHLKRSPEKLEAAYLLLDFMISPEIQKKIFEMYGSIAVNTQALKLLDEESAKASKIGDESFFKEEWFWKPLTDRTRETYKRMWDNALEKIGKANKK